MLFTQKHIGCPCKIDIFPDGNITFTFGQGDHEERLSTNYSRIVATKQSLIFSIDKWCSYKFISFGGSWVLTDGGDTIID